MDNSKKQPMVSGCCEGEKCSICGEPTTQKVAQVQFDDVPSIGHGYTAYLCTEHFNLVMGIKPKEKEIEPYMMLKWGSINGGYFKGSEEASQLFSTLNSVDNPEKKKKIEYKIIDLFNGEIIIWWGSEKVNKRKAKAYIKNYGK